jgi:hypothetical protein
MRQPFVLTHIPVNPDDGAIVPLPPYPSPMSISFSPFVLMLADMILEVPVAAVGTLTLGSKGLAKLYPEMAKISAPIEILATETVMPIEGFERVWLAIAYHSDIFPPIPFETSVRLLQVRPWLLVTAVTIAELFRAICNMTRSLAPFVLKPGVYVLH